MDKNKFTEKLFQGDFPKGKNVNKKDNIYGKILSQVFDGVTEYKDRQDGSVIKIADVFGGKYKDLGEYFMKHHQNGIYEVVHNSVITHSGLCIYLFDNKFIVLDLRHSYDRVSSLMKKTYQRKYVEQMYKIFGEPYKEHYQALIEEKINNLREEADLLG